MYKDIWYETEDSLRLKDLGFYFDGVSGLLITMMYNRIANETAENRRFKSKVERRKKQTFKM